MCVRPLLLLATARSPIAARVASMSATLEANRTLKVFELSSQYGGRQNFDHLQSCDPPCSQAASADDADVVYAYSGQTAPQRSHDAQVWVGTFWESPGHYPAQGHDFDYSRSYRPDATFPRFDMIPRLMADVFDERLERLRSGSQWPRRVPFAEKAASPQMIAVWISDCFVDNTRLDLAADLNDAGVPFASYGKCMHNAETGNSASLGQAALEEARISQFLQRTHKDPSPRDRDMFETSSKHLFFFAAENSDCSYYHTEKVYHGLLSGTIPVYVGNADTIAGYVPKGSIIKASEFQSNQDLAAYLREVASNESLYNSYFDWYGQNLSDTSASFREKLLTRRRGGGPSKCNECAFLHSHGRNQAFNKKVLGCAA